MKKYALSFFVIVALVLHSCTSNNKKYLSEAEIRIDEITSVMDDCGNQLKKYNSDKTLKNYIDLYNKIPNLTTSCSGIEMTETEYKKYKAIKKSADSLKSVINNTITEDFSLYDIVVFREKDKLIESNHTLPFYAHKGEELNLKLFSQDKFNFKIYNADSKREVLNSRYTNEVDRTITIPNTAIYLLVINISNPIYIDYELSKKAHEVKDLLEKRKKVVVDTIPSTGSGFRAKQVKGVKLTNVFEEPRKITLRSQGKALFSGSSRSIIALNLPANTSDVMYCLRISTSDSDNTSDGQFFDKTNKRYHEIRFLGLPLYESSRNNNSLLRELLLATKPHREEEAYCDMYVFKRAVDARKFQNHTEISKVKYNLDYSIVGTQSCNGRIPTNGARTIYLGFNNPKMTSSVYLWLEAVTTVRTTEYFKEKYTVK